MMGAPTPERLAELLAISRAQASDGPPAAATRPIVVDERGYAFGLCPYDPEGSISSYVHAGVRLAWAPMPVQDGLLLSLWGGFEPEAGYDDEGITSFITAEGLRRLAEDLFAIAGTSFDPLADTGAITPPGGEGVPAGMKPYGPDHPDYPHPPRDQARLGLPMRRSGASAVGLDWRHHAPDHHRYPHDIVAYWPDAALATTSPDTSTDSGAHPDDLAVERFAAKMKAKLARAREKGAAGWDDPAQCSPAILSAMLHDHVAKGEPVDVAAFAMMIEHYGASISPSPSPAIVKEAGEVGYDLTWIGAPRPPIHPVEMTGRQSFSTFDAAVSFMRRRPTDAKFVSLRQRTTSIVDRSADVVAALSASNAAQVSK